LARALYKQADVIILDEATSSLDMATELAVMDTIQALSSNITIIIIAHRHSALKNCNRVYELIDGKVTLTNYSLLTEKTSRNGKVWGMPNEDVDSWELPQAPMDGFTAFLDRLLHTKQT